jgi:hypothetical protein
VWPGAVVVAAIGLFFCYLRLADTYPVGSDGADQALQAWDVLHGNLLLHGWTIADVTYYTTEIPEYMLLELVRGLTPDIVHIAAATTYTLFVLFIGILAKGKATGREGLVRALVASGIVLAPQLGNAIHLVLSEPDHMGTQVPVLLIFIVLDRAPRRWFTPVVIAAMLTWVVVSDRVTIFEAAVPLAAACGVRALWAVLRDRKSLASQWFELWLAAAGLLSLAAAAIVGRVIRDLGGYTLLPLNTTRTSIRLLPAHLVLTMEGILNVYGADVFHISPGSSLFGPASGGLSPGLAVAVAVVHLVGVGLALWGVFRAFRYFFSGSDLIIPVLATGIVIPLAAYVFSLDPQTLFDTREIIAVLPFGAVLAGRMLGGSLIKARLEPVLGGVLACYALALAYGVAQPGVGNPEQPVVGWLEAHHLTAGLGTYTEANLLTLDTGGRVAVRTASWHLTGAVPRAFESKASWYDPKVSYANFIISNSADTGRGVSVVPRADILAFAGPPAHTYHYKTFTIMVWNKNLLADLGSPPSTKPGNIP